MRRLINVDNLLDNIKLIQHPELLTIDDWIDIVGQESTVEAVPVVHAHWECRDSALTYEGEFGAYVCSNCNKVFLDDLCQDDGQKWLTQEKNLRIARIAEQGWMRQPRMVSLSEAKGRY